jgi:hypothetical protein
MRIFLWLVAGVLLLGGLAVGGILFVMMGGTEMVEAWFAVRGRSYRADTWMEAGNSLRMMLPRGFKPLRRVGSRVFSDKEMPYASFVSLEELRFEAELGRYVPINSREWSARATVTIYAPEVGRRDGEGMRLTRGPAGEVVLVDVGRGRRIEFVAKPGIYTTEQSELIAREALASLTFDAVAVEGLFARRRQYEADKPVRQKRALEWIRANVKSPDIVYYLSAERESALFYAYLGKVAASDWRRLRESRAGAAEGLRALSWREGKLREWKVVVGLEPLDENWEMPQELREQLERATPPDAVTLWRRANSDNFLDDGTSWLVAWFAEVERARGAGPQLWALE